MSSLLRSHQRAGNRLRGEKYILKSGTKKRELIVKKVRSRIITLASPWKCSCNKEVKKGEAAWLVAGYQLCSECYWRKAPMIFGMKGWGEVPGKII